MSQYPNCILWHASWKVTWEGPWIYLGLDYIKLKKWEQKLNGKRISLADEIAIQNKQQKKVILNWINKQKEANKDSIYWWMTELAGRNNFACRFFADIVSIAAVLNYISNRQFKKETYLIICEDAFLLASCKKNINKIQIKKIINFSSFIYLYELLKIFFTGVLKTILTFANLLSQYYAAKKSKSLKSKIKLPHKNIYIFHQCLDDKSFLKNGKITDRYFTFLPSWLSNRGKSVFGLPWLYNTALPKKKMYKLLRKNNFLIKEDFLNLLDYVYSFIFSIKSALSIKLDIPFAQKNFIDLLYRQKFSEMLFGSFKIPFILWYFATPRFSSNILSAKFFDTYENSISEFIHPFVWRTKLKHIKSYFFGYAHCLVSSDYLAYHAIKNESKSQVFPDKIITNGLQLFNMLKKQGMPKSKLINGPALRFSSKTQIRKISKRKYLGVPLSLNSNLSIELLDQTYQKCSTFLSKLKINVIIKPHPMEPLENVLKKIKWNKLPDGWCAFSGDSKSFFGECLCSLNMASASIWDAILSECIVIPIIPQLISAWNYGDSLQSKYPMLQPCKMEEVNEKIKDILSNTKIYKKQICEIVRQKHHLFGDTSATQLKKII